MTPEVILKKEVNLWEREILLEFIKLLIFFIIGVALLFIVPLFTSSFVFQESYAAIEKAIRTLANFYSKEGPFATMTDEVKATILGDLKTAEDFL